MKNATVLRQQQNVNITVRIYTEATTKMKNAGRKEKLDLRKKIEMKEKLRNFG